MLKVVGKCCDMQEKKLYKVAPEATYTLGSFRDEQKAHLEVVAEALGAERETLTDFVEEVYYMVLCHCFCCFGLCES